MVVKVVMVKVGDGSHGLWRSSVGPGMCLTYRALQGFFFGKEVVQHSFHNGGAFPGGRGAFPQQGRDRRVVEQLHSSTKYSVSRNIPVPKISQ
jgi:hypothetical protein